MKPPKRTTPLRQVRLASGLIQKEFAQYLGFGRETYHSLELGRIGLTREKAETISEKTGAAPGSLDCKKSQEARDLHGAPYTSVTWDSWQHRDIGFAGPMKRIENAMDWLRFLAIIAEKQNKLCSLSFELADCLTKAIDKLDLRGAVERELRRTKMRVGLICSFKDLRQNPRLAKEAGFKDNDPSVPDEATWTGLITRDPSWDPQVAFPFELAKRLGLAQGQWTL